MSFTLLMTKASSRVEASLHYRKKRYMLIVTVLCSLCAEHMIFYVEGKSVCRRDISNFKNHPVIKPSPTIYGYRHQTRGANSEPFIGVQSTAGGSLPLDGAFITTGDVVSHNRYARCNCRMSNLGPLCLTGSTHCRGEPLRLLPSQYKHGLNPNIILGGDVDTPPGLLHSVGDNDISNFSQDMWNKGVSLEESVERLNLLDSVQPAKVMDNFLYGSGTISDGEHEDDTDALESKGSPSIEAPIEIHNGGAKATSHTVGNDTCTHKVGTGSESVQNEAEATDERIGDVPGLVLQPEHIDKEQYMLETSDEKCIFRDENVDYGMESDHDNPTGIDEVNYSALSSNEVHLVLSLMQSKLEAPESHEHILKELLAGDTGGLTEEQCRCYFDKFIRIGDILLSLNETLGMKPLQVGWITEIQTRIRDFVHSRGCRVSSIKWTEHDVIVSLKAGITEAKLASVHDDLAAFLATDGGADICPGIKNIGILMCTDTPNKTD